MGLFSSTVTYTAYAGSSALLEEDTRENTVLSLMLQEVIGGKGSLANAIKLGLQTNMYARARSMVRYATRSDGYYYGLPETTHSSLYVDLADIIAVIEFEEGEPIVEIAIRYGTPTILFKLYKWIHENYLNPAYFNWPSGFPADTSWDQDDPKAIPVVNPDTLEYYTSAAPPNYVQLPGTFTYTLSFPYTDNLGNPQVWNMPGVVDLTFYEGSEWLIAEYYPVSSPDEHKYWTYEVGSNLNPALEAQITSDSLNFKYLPIAVLMHDRVWFDEESNPPLEETTKRLLKRLALDPYEIKEDYIATVEEAIASGERPGTDQLDDWDFFIHFAVPMHSQIRGSREYMFHFFQFLNNSAAWTTYDDYVAFLASGASGTQPSSNFHISEGENSSSDWTVVSTGYEIYYAWSYIFTVTYPGQYTPPGWVDPLLPRRMYSKIYQFGSSDYSEGIFEVHGPGAPVATSEPSGQYHDYAVFTRQNQELDGSYNYTQVLIMAPSMMYVINTQENGTGIQYVDAPLFPDDPLEESEFRWPIHIGSLREVSTMHREELLQDALCGTVFLVERIKVKWYQKSFFKWLIVIIVIIVVILLYQYELLGTVYGMAASAFAAGATGTAIALAALYVTMVFAIGFLISFAGSLIGGTWGDLFVLVASIYAMGVNPWSQVSGAWANMTTQASFGSAFKFLQSIMPYMNFGFEIYNNIALGKLEDDMRNFMKTMKERYEELKDAWDALGPPPSWLDPMDLIKVQSANHIESPESFFNRSLNPNPGLLGYDLISNFTEIAFMLPENPGEGTIIDAMFKDFERQRGAA